MIGHKTNHLIRALVAVGCLTACGSDVPQQTAGAPKPVTQAQRGAEQVRGLVFIRHEASGLCFAYAWTGMANGGGAMALVPEQHCGG